MLRRGLLLVGRKLPCIRITASSHVNSRSSFFPIIHRNEVQKMHLITWFKSKNENPEFFEHLSKIMDQFSIWCPYRKFSRPGIYKLINNSNGKIYIGLSLNMRDRIKRHVMDAFVYKYDPTRYKSYSLVAENMAQCNFNFSFEIQEVVSLPRAELQQIKTQYKGINYNVPKIIKERLKLLLVERERFWINYYQSYLVDKGYNVAIPPISPDELAQQVSVLEKKATRKSKTKKMEEEKPNE